MRFRTIGVGIHAELIGTTPSKIQKSQIRGRFNSGDHFGIKVWLVEKTTLLSLEAISDDGFCKGCREVERRIEHLERLVGVGKTAGAVSSPERNCRLGGLDDPWPFVERILDGAVLYPLEAEFHVKSFAPSAARATSLA